MRRHILSLIVLSSALALGGCGKPEVKTGDLTQRFTMTDANGVQFGIVTLSPINGGTLYDMKGQLIGNIVPPTQTVAAIQ